MSRHCFTYERIATNYSMHFKLLLFGSNFGISNKFQGVFSGEGSKMLEVSSYFRPERNREGKWPVLLRTSRSEPGLLFI